MLDFQPPVLINPCMQVCLYVCMHIIMYTNLKIWCYVLTPRDGLDTVWTPIRNPNAYPDQCRYVKRYVMYVHMQCIHVCMHACLHLNRQIGKHKYVHIWCCYLTENHSTTGSIRNLSLQTNVYKLIYNANNYRTTKRVTITVSRCISCAKKNPKSYFHYFKTILPIYSSFDLYARCLY